MKKLSLFIFFALFSFIGKSQKITASPSWAVSVPTNTITEAGTDYNTNVTSTTNQTLIDIKTSGLKNYTISVQKVDSDWDPRLSLWVQRSGDGSGSGGQNVSLTGGTTFIQVTNSPRAFFYDISGEAHNRNNIPIQYEIRGLSVLIPVKTYTTTVVYTISN